MRSFIWSSCVYIFIIMFIMGNCRDSHGNRADALTRKDSFYHFVIQYPRSRGKELQEEIKKKMQKEKWHHYCGESLVFSRWMKSLNWEPCLICSLFCCLSVCALSSRFLQTHLDTSFIPAPLPMSVFVYFMQHMNEWKPTVSFGFSC